LARVSANSPLAFATAVHCPTDTPGAEVEARVKATVCPASAPSAFPLRVSPEALVDWFRYRVSVPVSAAGALRLNTGGVRSTTKRWVTTALALPLPSSACKAIRYSPSCKLPRFPVSLPF